MNIENTLYYRFGKISVDENPARDSTRYIKYHCTHKNCRHYNPNFVLCLCVYLRIVKFHMFFSHFGF